MDVLENLLNEAINPSSQKYSSDTIKTIIKLINSDPNSIPIALRLISHRFQSPQEREALNALSLLDTLSKQCGASFLSELGKFKFLNEMIKVLSPKFLGDQSTVAVKHKCIHLLYQWQRDYSASEPKFADAYNMLCKQGIINPDEIPSNGSRAGSGTEAPPPVSAKGPNIFDRSAQSHKLAGLLRSRNPNDVAEANRIIKSILEEDQKRMDKVTQRSTEMESLKNNTMLLEELTRTLARGDATESELEVMHELGQNIRNSRTVLYNFSLTHEENDIDTLTEIAQLCEQASTALNSYEQQLAHPTNGKTNGKANSHDQRTPTQSVDDLLAQDLQKLGVDETLSQSQSSPSLDPMTLTHPFLGDETPKTHSSSRYDELADIFAKISSSGSQSNPPLLSASVIGSPTTVPSLNLTQSSLERQKQSPPKSAKTPVSDMFSDLDTMGRCMLGLDTIRSGNTPPVQPESVVSLVHKPLATSSNCTKLGDPPSSDTIPPVPVNLSNIDVPLSSIRPHETYKQPFILFPTPRVGPSEPGIQLALHHTSNRPGQNVLVFVAVVTNHGSSSVTDLNIRFGVPKPLHIRQLTMSGHSLSAYSPFLPISALNQVILIHDPLGKPELAIKFQLSFSQGDDAVLESGEVQIPV